MITTSNDLGLDWQPKQFTRKLWLLRCGDPKLGTNKALKGAGHFGSKQAALDYLAHQRKINA